MRACWSCLVDNTAIIPTSVQGTVNNIYRACLSSNKEVIFNLIWSKTQKENASLLSVKINNMPVSISESKGAFSCIMNTSIIGICWDFSNASYSSMGPEPVSGFYIAIMYDKEFALLVGDKSKEFAKAINEGKSFSVASFSMIGKTVKMIGKSNAYSSKVKFCEEIGKEHEVVIKFKGKKEEMKMYLDGRKVMHNRKLSWNFRGNESFNVDGVVVDVMWDLHQWIPGEPSGCALVMVRRRISKMNRIWLEEEEMMNGDGFSLLMQIYQ